MMVTDIDGTLLNDDQRISDHTKDMIRSVKDDIVFVLASARGYYSIEPLVKELALDDQYVIAFNGAYVINTDGRILNDVPLEREIIYRLLAVIKDSELPLKVYLYHQSGRVAVDDIDVDEYLIDRRIYKLVADGTEDDIRKIRLILKDVDDIPGVTSSLSTRIEAVAKGINKVDAIRMIAEMSDIMPSQIVCVGDGENDIEMLRYAGLGVSMANGQKEVIRCADIIAADNNNDGIAGIIDLLFM